MKDAAWGWPSVAGWPISSGEPCPSRASRAKAVSSGWICRFPWRTIPMTSGHTGDSNDNTVSRKRILLADPSEASGMVTALMLARAGFEVETVTGGLEALRLARLHRFDAMVIDMALPDMNGDHDGQGAAATAPVSTARSRSWRSRAALDAYDDQRCLAAGATDLMVKPFRKSNLLERLERLVRTASEP